MEHPDLIDKDGDVWKWVDGGYRCGGDPNVPICILGYLEQVYKAKAIEVPEVTRVVSPAQPVGDPVYLGLLDELRELHLKKAADYGDGADPLANLRQSESLGIKPWVGCMLRCNDKMQRVRSLIRNGSLANESIEDNLKDMAAYCLLALKFVKEGK